MARTDVRITTFIVDAARYQASGRRVLNLRLGDTRTRSLIRTVLCTYEKCILLVQEISI